MMAKAQQIIFESRVRLLTVLHEAYQKKKHTQMDQKEHNCPRMMMAKAQQIIFESRVRLLTVLHEDYQKKKHTQMDQKEHNSNWRC